MGIFLFKFSACLAIFWLVYMLVLEQQKNHRFKRFFLLGAFVVALIIPLFTITTYVEPIIQTLDSPDTTFPIEPMTMQPTISVEDPFNWFALIWTIYWIGVSAFVLRFIINLFNIGRLIHNHTKVKKNGFIYVLLKSLKIPHSFLKFIFVNEAQYKNRVVPKEVLVHEEAHAKQLHSLDILVIELIQIMFWFHPLIYILKHHIKLNHEFLADQAVLNQGAETKNYQHILLQFSSNTSHHQLASSINYSSIKKRLTVMKTQTSKRRIVISTVLLIPIIALLFYGFAEREYIEISYAKTEQDIDNNLESSNLYQLEYIEANNPVKEYLIKYKAYKKLQDTPPHYINKTKIEQKKMDDLFSDLGGMYFRMSKANKSKVNRPSAPVVPYAKITLNGKTYYKKKNELTKDEIATLPPPPPPPAKKTKGGPNMENTQEAYNPSFLEYIIEMEQLGASFFLESEQITVDKAKTIAQNIQGKHTEMITQKDPNGNYLVKLFHPQKKHLYARSIEVKILKENTYMIDGIKASKKTFVQVFNQLHQDISAATRRKIMNIHVSSSEKIPNEEVWFIYNSLQDYGFYRIVTPNQIVNAAKGNTPFAIEDDNEVQQKATKQQITEYNIWAKKINAAMKKAEESKDLNAYPNAYPIIKLKDFKKYKHLYSVVMTEAQRKNAEPFPDKFPPPPPRPASDAPKVKKLKEVPPPPPKEKTKSTEYKKQNNQQALIDYLAREKNHGAILTHVDAQPSKLPFYDTHLTLDEASEHINKNPDMRLYPYNSPSGNYVVLISNNIENIIPKLNNTNKIEHLNMIGSIGAQFFVGDERVSLDKAKRFVRKNQSATISSTINPPVVKINSL